MNGTTPEWIGDRGIPSASHHKSRLDALGVVIALGAIRMIRKIPESVDPSFLMPVAAPGTISNKGQ
jgi:hypothetical protein